MKKGSKMKSESKTKVSLGLKEYFKKNPAWNKGLKYGKYKESSNKRFRRSKEYYLRELEVNAKRSRLKKEIYLNDDRRGCIRELHNSYQKQTGKGRAPKEWTPEEVKYIRDNYPEKTFMEIALFLGRSWSSISHKCERLGLSKYNKWN